MKTFKLFSKFSGLKRNMLKCEVAGIGSLKVKMAVCGINCIDLTTETIKILGVHFSYNQKLKIQKNFVKSITNMQNVLNLWRMRNITLEGKIIIFKTLALSKIVYLTLITSFSKQLIEEIQRIQKAFIWNNLTPKIKHETLCNSFEEDGLKNVDINSKIASLQCSWVKRLYDDKFHEWKLIPLHLIKSTFGINFKSNSNLDFDNSKIFTFPSFYKQLFRNWRKYLSYAVNIPSPILSQPIWYNKKIKINSKPIYVEEFAKKTSFSYMTLLTLKMTLKRSGMK